MYSHSHAAENSLIRETIRTRHPDTVGQLAKMLAETGDFEEESFVDTVKSMMRDGSIRLLPPSYEIHSVLDYLFTVTVSGEFWLIFLLAITSATMIDLMPNPFPISILRLILGSILLCLPGYSTIKLLFPSSQLRLPERLALSFAVSLAVVPIIGFILNFTPWGIRFQPILICLAVYTIITVTAAASREYLTLMEAAED